MAKSAYFTGLQVQNIRCFSDGELDLTADAGRRPARWTLMLGDNGVGKTTLLQCLAWMTPWKVGASQDEVPEPTLFDEENIFLERLQPANRQKNLGITATLSVGGGLFAVDEQAKPAATRARKVNTRISITFDKRRELRGHHSEISSKSDVECLVVAYGANRQRGVANLGNLMLADARQNSARLADVTELYDAEQMLQDLDYASSKDKTQLEDLKRLKMALATILPEEVDADAFRIFPPDPLGRGKRSGVYLETFSGLVPWAGLSLGYRTTLAWTADLAWRLLKAYPDSRDPLGEPVVVLIDEIDLHLHPRWQRGILADLSATFRGAQFVATTHSPLVAQTGEDANFALLRRREGSDDVEIVNDPEVVRTWRLDQFVTSELFGSLSGRSPQIERQLTRRTELIAKRSRTREEQAELRRLHNEISELPTADSPEDQEAMDIVRKAAELLKKPNVAE